MSFNIPGGRYSGTSTEFIKAYIDSKVSGVVSQSPETLNTLKELAEAIGSDPAFFTTMATANSNLQNQINVIHTDSDAAELALSNRLNTLEADPTTATAVAAVQTDVDANEAAALAARTALQTLLQNAIDAVQADVNTNESDADTAIAAEATARAAAITALQADVDQNETDADAAITAANVAMLAAVAAVQADVDQNETDADTAIALRATITQLDAVQADVDANEADADAAIALKFDKAGGSITGNFAVAKSFPDIELKAGDEKRILFADAGGAATAALKHVSGSLDFYVGGIASGNKEMSLDTDGLDVTALKIGGTAITATATEINAFDGRLDTLEADATTATAVAAVQADVNQNESDADAAIAAVQADVDQNESDADAAIALKAPLADPDFTGLAEFVRSKVTNPSSNASDNALYVVQESFGNFGIQCRSARLGLNVFTDRTNAADVLFRVGDSTNNNLVELYGADGGFQINTDIIQHPSASVTPANNGELMVEATNNTTLTFKLKGSDGTVRSGTITLS